MVDLLLMSATDNARAQQPAMDKADNTALIEHAFNAWAAGTGGPYDLLAEDAVWTIT